MVPALARSMEGARNIYFCSLYQYLDGLAQQILHVAINVGEFFSFIYVEHCHLCKHFTSCLWLAPFIKLKKEI